MIFNSRFVKFAIWPATLFLFAGLTGPISTLASEPTRCEIQKVDKLDWITSGVWISQDSQSSLVLADSSRLGLAGLSRGNGSSQVNLDIQSRVLDLGEVEISKVRAGAAQLSFWIEDESGDSLLELDGVSGFTGRSFRFGRNIEYSVDGKLAEIREIYDWLPTSRDEIVGFADFQWSDDKTWGCGLVRMKLGEKYVELLRKFELYSWPVHHLVRNRQFFGRLNEEVAFFLVPDEEPWLGRITSQGLEKFAEVPAEFSNPGREDGRQLSFTAGAALATYLGYEKLTMVTSVLTWNERLFLVARKPLGQGLSRATWGWFLLEVDTETGELARRFELPEPFSTAAHTTVVAGESEWAWVLKSPVVDVGFANAPYMAINEIAFVSSEVLNSSAQNEIGDCVEAQ